MSGWQMILAQTAIFIAAVGAIVWFSVLTLRFAGPAMSRARVWRSRAWHGLIAALCLAGIVISAALGFVGLAGVQYIALKQ
ncbi:MAG: hypothetical protein JNJ73_01640 [Hyphomonadaceae bacterium]|nr:hypothetical protein [Hyphomonadaceae bacterium]